MSRFLFTEHGKATVFEGIQQGNALIEPLKKQTPLRLTRTPCATVDQQRRRTMTMLKQLSMAAAAIGIMSAAPAIAQEIKTPADAANFYQSDKVSMQPVTFLNQYKMTIAGNLFTP